MSASRQSGFYTRLCHLIMWDRSFFSSSVLPIPTFLAIRGWVQPVRTTFVSIIWGRLKNAEFWVLPRPLGRRSLEFNTHSEPLLSQSRLQGDLTRLSTSPSASKAHLNPPRPGAALTRRRRRRRRGQQAELAPPPGAEGQHGAHALSPGSGPTWRRAVGTWQGMVAAERGLRGRPGRASSEAEPPWSVACGGFPSWGIGGPDLGCREAKETCPRRGLEKGGDSSPATELGIWLGVDVAHEHI